MLCYLVFMVVLSMKTSTVFSSEPQIIPFTLPSDLVLGGKVKAMCSVSKGSHPIKFEWLFNGHNLYETNDQFVQNLDDASILNIKNLQLIHNSNISCVATNRFGKDVYTSLLVVNAAPQWVKRAPELLKVKENEPVQLDCLVNGHPTPRITWTKSLTKNSKDSSEPSQQLKSLPNGTLQLDSVQKADEGEYVCTVDNKIGEKLVSRTQIEVQTPAKVSMIDNSGRELVASETGELPVNYARKGEEFSIRCKAIGDQPLTIDWFKNHELMQYKFSSNMETLNSLSPSGLISELHWRSIQRSDSATYECAVKNSLGESRMGQKLVVLEPPEAPKNVKISDLDSNSAKVSWQLGYAGNLELTRIHVYYWESKTKRQTGGNQKLNKIEIDLATSTWHVLKQLKSGTAYSVAVTCVNSVGESAFSAPVEFETKMKSPTLKPDLTIRKVFGNKIEIAWKYPLQERKAANVTGFQVFYKPIDEQNYFIERITATDNELEPATEEMHLTLVNLKKNTKYLVKVKAYNREGYSPDSDEIEITTLRGNVPSAPLITQHQVHSKSYLIVKWEHSNSPTNLNAALRHEEPNSPPNEHQHQLVPKTDDGGLEDFDSAVQFFMAYVEVSSLRMVVQTIPIPATMRQVTITNLDQDVQHTIYLTATNNYGESEYSEPLILTIRSYQYEMSLFMAERNALVITAVSIGATCIVVSIICSCIYLKKFQLAQQEKIRKMSTLTLSKCGTNKTTATYATIGNGTNAQFTNYTAQQMTPSSQAYQQPSTSAYQEIGLTYDLATGGLSTSGLKSVTQTPHHLTTFGHVTLSSDRSSDAEDLHALQIKDRFRQSNKSLDSLKNMRINYDECIYDDALG